MIECAGQRYFQWLGAFGRRGTESGFLRTFCGLRVIPPPLHTDLVVMP